MVTNILLVTIVFTVLIFVGSLLLLIAAAIFYIPLLCSIRGNLKEYCCHKVDKVRQLISIILAETDIFPAYLGNGQEEEEAASC